MTCEQLIAFLADYLDGTLPVETIALFESHLAGCRSCTAYLTTYRETIRLTRLTAASPTLLDDAPEELIAAILGASLRG